MWPSNDATCAEVARLFYEDLLAKGSISLGTGRFPKDCTLQWKKCVHRIGFNRTSGHSISTRARKLGELYYKY